ncbi:MAG: glycosyltransferase family 9 protein [Acidobacteria bacterium]|uniref:Glycosyltransferase family 9 protein n=1 Tax=Candidatus Polarisedimenticola svalbardensis TaxID=2886004 RepID=A0A8J6XX29_9BACT|nr:glycosyltransferase family 9 protein [Candidatus Polarisedimenticola svalbardensis]
MLDGTAAVRQVDRKDGEIRVAGKPIPGVRRIVLVRDDSIEDFVCSLPAIAAVRETYPGAWLSVLVRPAVVPLARMAPDIDEVLAPKRTVEGMEQAFHRFRPDLMISLSRTSRAAWAGWRAKVPHRIGTGFRLYSPLFTDRVDERRRAGVFHEVEYALSFAHRAGAPASPARFRLTVPLKARDSIGNWLDLHRVSRPFVVIHPGAAPGCPAWPAVHFVQLATLLEAESTQVVFSMGEGDRPFVRALEEDHPFLRRLPRFEGDEEARAALFSLAAVAVGNGAGTVHLASALGVPTLTLHAPWRGCGYQRRGPYAANGWALVAESEEAKGWSPRRRQILGPQLMNAVTPADARRSVVAMMAGGEPELGTA